MFLAAMTALLTLFPSIAYAYIDPASGLIISQLLIGVAAGVFLTVKQYWRKFVGMFQSKDAFESEKLNETEEK